MSSNGIQGNSSFWRRNGSASKDQKSAPSGSGWGRPVSSNRPAAGGGESERPPSSFKPPAAGGGGWGRPPGPPSSSAAGGGRLGPPSSFKPPPAGGGAARPSSPPNFAIVLIAALLLLPGVTQPIANEFTKDYVQRNHILDPHTQDNIERAIAAFHLQHQQKPPAPPEGYTTEYVSYCFHEKYDLPENLQASFDANVSSYITKNPKPFTMMLQTAVDRALLRIHESLSEGNGGKIPEKDSRPPPPAPAPAPSLSLQPPPSHFRHQGARILEDVITHGLSPKTIGHGMFDKLMKMKNGPRHRHVWAFQSCPIPRTLIRALSFKRAVDGIPNISCFISGFIIEPNGKVVQFNYPNLENPMIGWKRDDLIGKAVIFWTSEVGQVIYTKTWQQFDSGQYDHTLGKGRKGAGYSGGNIKYDDQGNVCTPGKLMLDGLDLEMKKDRDAFFEREHVTASERENLDVFGPNNQLEHEIRSSLQYQAACEEAMAQIGGMPVSFCSTPRHEEAVKAAGSDQSGEEALFERCYHGNPVKAFDEYTLCQECKSHPGKQPIMDGWGTGVVGYRQGP
jgi:hypothetical protein